MSWVRIHPEQVAQAQRGRRLGRVPGVDEVLAIGGQDLPVKPDQDQDQGLHQDQDQKMQWESAATGRENGIVVLEESFLHENDEEGGVEENEYKKVSHFNIVSANARSLTCLLYTSPSPRD